MPKKHSATARRVATRKPLLERAKVRNDPCVTLIVNG